MPFTGTYTTLHAFPKPTAASSGWDAEVNTELIDKLDAIIVDRQPGTSFTQRSGSAALGGYGLFASGLGTGIGVALPGAQFEARGTGVQARLSYNPTHRTDLWTDSIGDFHIAPTGGQTLFPGDVTISGTLVAGLVSGSFSAIDNTPIGATTPHTGAFTTLSATGATTLRGHSVPGGSADTFALLAATQTLTNKTLGAGSVWSGGVITNAYVADDLTITGGVINATPIGGTTRAAGAFVSVAITTWLTVGTSIDTATLAVATSSALGTVTSGVWQGTAILDAYIDGTLTITGGSVDGTPIGATTRSSGAFTTLAVTTSSILGTVTSGAWNGATIADFYIDNVLTITGGTIDGTPIGNSTRAVGSFTSLTVTTWIVAGSSIDATTYVQTPDLHSAGALLIYSTNAHLTLTTVTGGDIILDPASGIIRPGALDHLQSPNFASGITGWRISGAGDAEFNNVHMRGALSATVFRVKEISATAGTLGVFYSASTLHEPFTLGGGAVAGSTTVVIRAKNTPDNASLFSVGSILRIKAFLGMSDVSISDTYFTVSGGDAAATYTDYTCVYQFGTKGLTFPAGVAIVDYGPSGTGFITLSADSAVGPTPNISLSRHAGAPWTVQELLGRIGNLNGSFGYVADTYGMAFGTYTDSATDNYFTVDPTNGMRLFFAGGDLVLDSDGLQVINQSGTSFITFRDAIGGNIRVNMYGYETSGTTQAHIGSNVYGSPRSNGGQLHLEANAGDGQALYVRLIASITDLYHVIDGSGSANWRGVTIGAWAVPLATLDVRGNAWFTKTTAQMRWRYDASNYATVEVGSAGYLTIETTGGRLSTTSNMGIGGVADATDKLKVTGSIWATSGIWADGKLTARLTTEQLRLDYGGGFYAAFTVGSDGDLTVTPSGGDMTISGHVHIPDGKWFTAGDAASNYGPPTFTTRSIGTKFIIAESVGGSAADYAFGIENGFIWSSVGNTAAGFKWYGGVTNLVTFHGDGNTVLRAQGSALATNATAGFTYLPGCAGVPTGVPALQPTGAYAVVIDTTTNGFYFYKPGTGWIAV